MTTDEVLTYYSNLLTAQYVTLGKATETIKSYLAEFFADQLAAQVRDGFDIETAIGKQLDMIGTYRGISREIFGLSLNKKFLNMPGYSDSTGSLRGFATYPDQGVNVSWFFTQYADTFNPLYALSDSEMKMLIKYLAGLHSLNLGLGDVDNFLHSNFGNYVTLVDNGDMSITYADDPADPSTLYGIVKQLDKFPHPAGVKVNS